MFPRKNDEHITLYQMFRDGLISEAIRTGPELHEWKLMPKAHIGRLPTMTLLRKMLRHMAKDYPGAFRNRKGKITFSREFLDFAQTHRDLGSNEKEVKQAWSAMHSITE